MGQDEINGRFGIEWPTLLLICACYAAWGAALWWLPLILGVVIGGIAIALHSSLQHEVIHGHPFQTQWLSEMLIWPPLMLTVPFVRFKATHLAHHHDEVITDPYDDPESNYLDPVVWYRLPGFIRALLWWNNTVAGRLILGPLIGTIAFLICEWRSRDLKVLRDWLFHVPAVAFVLGAVWVSPMPIWAYLVAMYLGMSLLKLRTFLEHQAHDRASGRSVIVENAGLFGWLFLNNNLHVVHHMHPRVAWYQLPALYRSRKDHYQRRNGGYFFRSYGEVIRRYLWTPKDPVAHPHWRR